MRPTRVRWLVFLLASTVSWLLYLHRYSWGVIKADVKLEFGLSDVELGWLDSAFNLSYALCQVPTGLLGDLLGPALIVPLSLLGWSGAVAATGLGTGFWSLAGVRTLFGALQAGAYPNLSKVTRSWFPLAVRTTVQGFIASFAGRAGGACASLVVASLLLGTLGLGWRAAMVWIGLLGIVLALAFRLLHRDRPEQHPWVNEAERCLIESDERHPQSPRRRMRLTREGAALRSFAAFLVQMFGVAFADQLFVYWIPLYLAEARGFDRVEMGKFASLPLWIGAVGGLTGGALNDLLIRAHGRRFARRAVGLTGTLLAAGLVVASVGFDDGRWAMVVLAGSKFFGDWGQPTVWGTVTDMGGRAAGTLFGVVNMAGSAGAFAAGPILGFVKQTFGWGEVFWLIGAVYLVSGLCWLVIDPTRKLTVEVE